MSAPILRWNIEREGDALLVCFGEHEKYEGCRFERFVPAAEIERLRALLGDLVELADAVMLLANHGVAEFDRKEELAKYRAALAEGK